MLMGKVLLPLILHFFAKFEITDSALTPTYPLSVNWLASAIYIGIFNILLNVLQINVLPVPV